MYKVEISFGELTWCIYRVPTIDIERQAADQQSTVFYPQMSVICSGTVDTLRHSVEVPSHDCGDGRICVDHRSKHQSDIEEIRENEGFH